MLLLDLFCCEGGATKGYLDGGLELLAGIDNNPKHIVRYSARFSGKGYTMGWAEGLAKFGEQADLIHASPPCQRFSSQSRDRAKAEARWLNLIPEVHAALEQLGKPYVIENVVGAKTELIDPVKLNGFMFPEDLICDWKPPSQIDRIIGESDDGHWFKCPHTGHPAYWCHVAAEDEVPIRWTIKRDRLFEVSGFNLVAPPEQPTDREVMSVTVSPNPTMVWNKINRQSVPLWVRQEVMGGLCWMTARGVGEAIPPPYTREIARQFLEQAGA